MITFEWVSPNSGQLATLLELVYGEPVFETNLETQYDDTTLSTSVDAVYYKVISSQAPDYYRIIHQESSMTAKLVIEPIVRELDHYVEEYKQPEDFTFDTDDVAGGNYATFGSALYGGKNFEFTIRAYDASSLDSYYDSNNELQYIENDLESLQHVDRTFSIYVFNNWSSDRDSFILDYYKDRTLSYNDEEYEAEDYLIKLKQDGYFD